MRVVNKQQQKLKHISKMFYEIVIELKLKENTKMLLLKKQSSHCKLDTTNQRSKSMALQLITT